METAYQTVLLQEENTALAREEMRLAQERYQLGAGTFLELLDSQTLTAQAEVDQIDAVFNFYQSLTQLEAAVGRPLDLQGSE
jgi:outer membrane protein